MLYIGLMSGTSLDGVDGALVDLSQDGVRSLGDAYVAFPPALRADLMALQAAGHNEIEREALAANALARHYADCVGALLAQAGIGPDAVAAIGAHGQTIRHRPELGFTRQLNNPALLAELSGIDVIADLRSRDVAAGGQGAPLVPAFHQALFNAPGQTRVVANIGGIGNISVLHADGRVTGFDTGPGNVLMDLWIARTRACLTTPTARGLRPAWSILPCSVSCSRSRISCCLRRKARGATCSMPAGCRTS